jgi:hypothetical protein
METRRMQQSEPGLPPAFLKEGPMTGLEALQSVQYVTAKGRRLAVIDIDEWEALIEWLETLEDVQAARQALDDLEAFGGDRERAGWLKWDEVKETLE